MYTDFEYDTFTAGPLEAKLYGEPYIDDFMNPIEDPETSARVVIFHRDYSQLSNTDLRDFDIYEERYSSRLVILSEDGEDEREVEGIEDIIEHLRKKYGAEVQLIKAYIHSGIRLSASPAVYNSFPDQMWDVTHAFGLIFMSRDDIAKARMAKRVTKKMRKWANEVMQAIMTEFDAYVSGDVYYCTVSRDDEYVDSVGGLMGVEHAEAYAKEMLYEAAMEHIIEPNTYISGEGDSRAMRFDDELGVTCGYVRIYKTGKTGKFWKAIVDRANVEDRYVLEHSDTLENCIRYGYRYFYGVLCGDQPDWVGKKYPRWVGEERVEGVA